MLYQSALHFSDLLPEGDFVLDHLREVVEILLECFGQNEWTYIDGGYRIERQPMKG